MVPTKPMTKGQQLGGHVAQFVVQEGHDQAGLLAHTDGQSHGQHQAQGGEAGEVGDHVLQEPQKSVFRNGVLDGHDLIGGGVDHRYTHQTQDTTDDGDDEEQIDKHNCGDGKLVTRALKNIQEFV